MKKLLLLYNIKAGHGKIDKNIDTLCSIFSEGGYNPKPKLIQFGINPFEGDEDSEVVVVCGGDGTINYIVNSQKSKGLNIPIGIIPAGTANDFAGAVGMSGNFLKAARQIVSGQVENLDCGKVNQTYYINIFSFGLFTTTSQRTSDAVKHKIGKLAYIIEGIKEIFHLPQIPLHIVYDGGQTDITTRMFMCFNGETAGRFKLARQASVRDGILDCVYMKKINIFSMIYAALYYLISGKPNFAVKIIRTSKLQITSSASPLTDMDGQRCVDFPVSIECIKGGIKVIVPKK